MSLVVNIVEVVEVDGRPVARGLAGPVAFEAGPVRWGTKMLMKVTGGDFDRGTRISIGHRAKAAIRLAGMVLPEAVLTRPRAPKVAAEVTTPAAAATEVAAEVNVDPFEILDASPRNTDPVSDDKVDHIEV